MTKLLRSVAASLLAATASLVFISNPAYADRYRDDQWHLPFLKISEVHKLSQGEGITVAVIDTGVDNKHPDLTNNVLPGLDVAMKGNGNGWGDEIGHGTGMAGLIAAHGRGSDGVLGIAPKAKILPIRVNLTEGSTFNGADLLVAIKEAVSRGAKVISMSLSADNSAAVETMQYIEANNIVVLAGAGNKGQENLMIPPGSFKGVLAVGALDRNGSVADISIRDDRVSLTAPGVDIVSSSRVTSTTQYRKSTGTSPATAIAAGTAAVLWSKNPQWTAKDVMRQLTTTATDKGAPGRDKDYGFGAVDPLKALTSPLAAVSPSGNPDPSVSVSVPGKEGDSKSSSTLLYVGIGVVVLLAVLIGAFFLLRRRR
ncbi:S8 family serine peptidase [Catelliglobosispora koreensis]|uniref:S8 family serine peptidase n=1 Tax=Catelliglobosispora koreensis TaxID=129052 RepID=UPI000380E908|nr:S8 family serine peptidase [Catelliglobosispora koreensis]